MPMHLLLIHQGLKITHARFEADFLKFHILLLVIKKNTFLKITDELTGNYKIFYTGNLSQYDQEA